MTGRAIKGIRTTTQSESITMSSEEAAPPSVQSPTQRLASWLDLESVAVITILFGLFQVLLCVPLAYSGTANMPKIFILPLLIGILVVIGGSLAMANERNPSRYLLQGCACSNAISLLGAIIAFCLYCVNIKRIPSPEMCEDFTNLRLRAECSGEYVMLYSLSILILLLFYDTGAIILNGILSALSLKELKKD